MLRFWFNVITANRKVNEKFWDIFGFFSIKLINSIFCLPLTDKSLSDPSLPFLVSVVFSLFSFLFLYIPYFTVTELQPIHEESILYVLTDIYFSSHFISILWRCSVTANIRFRCYVQKIMSRHIILNFILWRFPAFQSYLHSLLLLGTWGEPPASLFGVLLLFVFHMH